jgi:hypothetical protein
MSRVQRMCIISEITRTSPVDLELVICEGWMLTMARGGHRGGMQIAKDEILPQLNMSSRHQQESLGTNKYVRGAK